MHDNRGSWIERSGRRFARLQEEANENLGRIFGGAEKTERAFFGQQVKM